MAGALSCELALVGGRPRPDVRIEVDDGRIVSVEVDGSSRHAERVAGLTLPGFANGHSHAFHRALRGRTHGMAGDFWTWRQQMYDVAARLTPENYRALARATFAEMVLAGYTCVGEFHYVHHDVDGAPYGDPNAMGLALIDAAAEAGIRLTLLDACYLRAGAGTPPDLVQRRFSDGTAEAWARRVDALVAAGEMVRVGAAVHSARAVDAASIALVAAHAERRSMVLHAHVSEQPAENEQVLAETGMTPTAVFAAAGAVTPRFTAVHATHLTAADIACYGSARATCCFCPTTERDLADGIGPSGELVAAGAVLTIGSDQHAVVDPFEELRGVEMDERLRSLKRGNHSAAALIEIGTANGYRSLGWDDGGTIEAGQLADLTVIGLDGVRLAGGDPAAAVFSATAADVDGVMVGGEWQVRDGRHLRLDVAGSLRASIADVLGGGR